MSRLRGGLVVLLVALAAAALPAVASAQLDPADSISLSAPAGHVYADYPFSFTGAGTVDGADADDYAVGVLFTPSSSPILRGGCPADYEATVEAIEQAFGGPGVIADFSALGITDPALLEQGPYTWDADVNGGVVQTVTQAGNYIACAYLGDESTGDAYAVSQPVPFAVTYAPGTGTPPSGFGGPRGRHEPALGLRVAARHTPIRAPGRNLLRISGNDDPQNGPADLVVTVKPTARFNGCASTDAEDVQVTRADGGAVLADYERVAPSSAGNFVAPLALNYTRRTTGTAVVCAYLVDGFGDDLAVGYLRYSARPPARHAGHRRRHA